MPWTSRAAWALGLGLGVIATAGLVAPTQAQDGAAKGAAAAPPAAARPPAAVIGSVDMDAIFKGYDKVKASSETLKTDALAKNAELVKLQSEMKQLTEKTQTFQPGTSDYKKLEAQFTKLKAQLDAEREQAQHDFQQREAQALAELYKEVQAMVSAVAKKKGMTYVVKVSNEPITGADPNSVMAAMARSIVYSDPSADITKDVLYNLNYYFNKSNPQGAKAPATSAVPTPGAATPKAN